VISREVDSGERIVDKVKKKIDSLPLTTYHLLLATISTC